MVPNFRNLMLFGASISAASPIYHQNAQELAGPTSQGFRLVAQVSQGRDITPSVNGLVLQGYHIGAGIDAAVLHTFNLASQGRTFYLNGTSFHDTSAITDSGSYPYGLTVPSPGIKNPAHGVAVTMKVGGGTPVHVAPSGSRFQLVNSLGKGTFLACNRYSEYYKRNLIMLELAYAECQKGRPINMAEDDVVMIDAEVAKDETCSKPVVPKECTAVDLILWCAGLPPVHPGGLSNHNHVQAVPCSPRI